MAQNDFQMKFTKPLNVLLIEDNQIDRKILQAMLKDVLNEPSEIFATDNLAEALKVIDSQRLDVVVLDLDLPDSKGENSLKILNNKYPHIPIVVNTGAYKEELGLNSLQYGAQDFLVKGKYTAYTLNKVLHYAVERKRLENDLKGACDKLQETQAHLIHAEKMKMVGILASGIAHEVRNPLATILYGVTYLDEQVKAEDTNYPTVIKNIKDATVRANSIITELLDFSGLSKSDLKIDDINAAVTRALNLLAHQIEKKAANIELDLDENLPRTLITKEKVEQVLINLMINALHAIAHGGVIHLKTEVIKLDDQFKGVPLADRKLYVEGEDVIRITIKDNGHGIKSEDLDHVFDPFFTSRRANGGIGLGLYVSQNIMEIHNGSIALFNGDENGACAALTFKLNHEV